MTAACAGFRAKRLLWMSVVRAREALGRMGLESLRCRQLDRVFGRIQACVCDQVSVAEGVTTENSHAVTNTGTASAVVLPDVNPMYAPGARKASFDESTDTCSAGLGLPSRNRYTHPSRVEDPDVACPGTHRMVTLRFSPLSSTMLCSVYHRSGDTVSLACTASPAPADTCSPAWEKVGSPLLRSRTPSNSTATADVMPS